MMTNKQLEARLHYAKMIRDVLITALIVSIFWSGRF
jgi:hypothetical protein